MNKNTVRNTTEKEIPIFYACDDNFVKFTIVSISSMIKRADKNRRYVIYILNAGISDVMQRETLKLENERFKIKFVDVKEQLEKIQTDLPLRDYYSKTTYFRMFIADMFPNYDKAIYIDSDTVILDDISKLFDVDLQDHYVAACNEQAMVQTEVYGNYVEKVMGISRNEYFNAGVLLINCKLFREEKVLEKFINLLGVYTFVVTQDQDYLNVICHNKVLWIDQGWNVEVYGQLPVKEEDIKIIHYIMVSKPWHYEDCRLKEYFWNAVAETTVKEMIVEELQNYSDDLRKKDFESCVRLAETAKQEALRLDTYINLISKKKVLRVLKF